jgi:hypothetical protein
MNRRGRILKLLFTGKKCYEEEEWNSTFLRSTWRGFEKQKFSEICYGEQVMDQNTLYYSAA